ncbi:diacylglycerol kinase family lipid kinase [candidate division KSB1 bacterium]|nr:diacylglycerol kinase family lipid kinase [candidate division KSB1 bacterium]
MKTKVIVNPDSKPRRIKQFLKAALSILRHSGFELSVYFTKGPGEVIPATEKAIEQGYEALIVAGGDGTTNEAINCLVNKDIPLGILPFGGSNVLVRELQIPMHPVEAAKRISEKRIRSIDLGRIGGKHFSMMASCGYDAYAVSRTSRKVKKIIHRYAYVWAGIKDFAGYRPTLITIILDDGKLIETGTFVVIGNTHFYGGSHQVTPFAEIDDGMLDVCVYKGKYQFGLARFALSVISQQHLNMRNVKYYRVRKVEMRAERPTLVQVDGDLLGELPMTAHVVPDALKVFY